MASRNGSEFALERADGGVEVYPEATKTGYSLSKWVDSEGNELSIHSIEEGKTFYASWIDDIPPVMTVEVTNDFAQEQTISISAVDEGSGVAGYYIGTDNPEETAVTYGDIVNMTVSETGMYYCSSIDIDGNVATEQIVFFAFTFDANGGSSVCERIIVQSGREVELVAPSKPGYSASWIEDSTGEVVTTAIADGDKSFTANYIDDIAPTFSVSITDDLASSQSFTLSATDEGSGVLGFYFGTSDPAQNVVTYTDVTNGVIDASGTYYFAVSDNAGNVVVESYTFHIFTLNANGSIDVLLAGGIEFMLPDVSKAGYSYVWVEDSTGSVVASSIVDADKSFTAQYTANQYTVTFDANGGVFEDGTSSCEKVVTYDEVYGELPTPTRAGYIFLGWYTEVTGGEEILRETKVSLPNAHSIYAQFGTMASIGSGTPAKMWDGNMSTTASVGGSSPTLRDDNVSSYSESSYSKFSYSTSYTFSQSRNISGITITMPTKNTCIGSYNTPLLYYKKVYSAVAKVYIDNVLYGEVPVSHGSTVQEFVCDFGQSVEGQTIKIVFSRNTVGYKGGQYYGDPYNQNLYMAGYYVYVSEIIAH